jgi:hypothetical protein
MKQLRMSLMPRHYIVLSVVLALFVSSHAAFAHESWISRHQYSDPESRDWRCDEHDCFPLDDDQVRATKEGFELNGNFFVARHRVLLSGDGQYWACFNTGGKGPHAREKEVRCFFAPMNS